MTAVLSEVEEVRLHLPKDIVARLTATAAERQVGMDSVVTEILADSLPSLKQNVDTEFEARIREMSSLTEAQLRECVRAEMEPQDKKRGRQLLTLNKQRPLTVKERSALDAVHKKGEDVATTRAAAIWLLQSRHKAVEMPK